MGSISKKKKIKFLSICMRKKFYLLFIYIKNKSLHCIVMILNLAVFNGNLSVIEKP